MLQMQRVCRTVADKLSAKLHIGRSRGYKPLKVPLQLVTGSVVSWGSSVESRSANLELCTCAIFPPAVLR